LGTANPTGLGGGGGGGPGTPGLFPIGTGFFFFPGGGPRFPTPGIFSGSFYLGGTHQALGGTRGQRFVFSQGKPIFPGGFFSPTEGGAGRGGGARGGFGGKNIFSMFFGTPVFSGAFRLPRPPKTWGRFLARGRIFLFPKQGRGGGAGFRSSRFLKPHQGGGTDAGGKGLYVSPPRGTKNGSGRGGGEIKKRAPSVGGDTPFSKGPHVF